LTAQSLSDNRLLRKQIRTDLRAQRPKTKAQEKVPRRKLSKKKKDWAPENPRQKILEA
jgi:hypothetical protein